jgi:hypothetical protein
MSITTNLIEAELKRARLYHKTGIRSTSEAVGVVREEYLEFEAEAFLKITNRTALKKELVQLAAMCVRAIEDLGL